VSVRRRGDGRQDLVHGGIGEGAHLIVGAILNRVGNKHPRRLEADGVALGLGRVDELGGGQEHTRQTTSLEISDVVHTARRAAPSVGQRLDHDVTFRGDLVAQVDGSRLGERWLAEPFDPKPAGHQLLL